MFELICNTSPLQYLHQLGCLEWLPKLGRHIYVPPSVVNELAAGKSLGCNVPDTLTLSWITIQAPTTDFSALEIFNLGQGELQVIQLGREIPNSVLMLDDQKARKAALNIGLKIRGTLGLLLDAKRAGLTDRISPWLDRLYSLGFFLSKQTRQLLVQQSGENTANHSST